jgi:hypothetical protein
VTITRRGQPVLAILPWEFCESLVEHVDNRILRWPAPVVRYDART